MPEREDPTQIYETEDSSSAEQSSATDSNESDPTPPPPSQCDHPEDQRRHVEFHADDTEPYDQFVCEVCETNIYVDYEISRTVAVEGGSEVEIDE